MWKTPLSEKELIEIMSEAARLVCKKFPRIFDASELVALCWLTNHWKKHAFCESRRRLFWTCHRVMYHIALAIKLRWIKDVQQNVSLDAPVLDGEKARATAVDCDTYRADVEKKDENEFVRNVAINVPSLTSLQRSILLAYYWDGMSLSQIGHVLHCSKQNVHEQLHIGLERIRPFLSHYHSAAHCIS